MSLFHHSFTRLAVYPSLPEFLCFSLSALGSECGHRNGTGEGWVEDQYRKVREPFPPKDGKCSGFPPCLQTWRLTVRSLDFPLWVLSVELCLLFLFYVFHFKDPITFSWILQWACWPNNSFIPNFHHYLCLKFHTHLGQRMCVKDTVPPLTGKAHIIGEPNLKCTMNVISSFLGGNYQVGCFRFRSGLTVCSSMAACAPQKCWDRHSLGVSREVCHSVSLQVHQSWTFSLQVCSFVTLCDCQRQSVVCKVFFLIQNCQISEK